MIGTLLALSTGTFISEDLACITAGVLVASGDLSFTSASLACFAGIAAGDLGLYCAGRLIGVRLKPWLGTERIRKASEWLSGNTTKAVLISRFVPGTRTYTYIAAGVLRAPARRFATSLVLASAVWTPILVGGTVALGREFITSLLSFRTGVLAIMVIAAVRTLAQLTGWEVRRKALGWLLRKIRWEFWPSWAAYLPLLPAFLYLALRHRSATAFTAANPGIPTGGLLDESKVAILRSIKEQSSVARWEVVQPGMLVDTDCEYPVVCKPDIGERGRGVKIIRTPDDLTHYVSSAEGTTIIQQYVAGQEFGVFYYRHPSQARGRISSITAKVFPCVTGDGIRTLRQLVLADARAVAIAGVYLRNRPDAVTFVPASGETVTLVEIGAHCRGTVFLDATSLRTPALERRVDEIASGIEGFYYGRFDVRAPSLEALQRGEFLILELNGVAAEPTHIYDPKVPITDAYKALWHHWCAAWAIGTENTQRGARPTPVGELLDLVSKRGRDLIRRHIHRLLPFRSARRNVPVKP